MAQPASAEVRQHKDRAAELLAKGKPEKALVEFQAALQLAPQDAAVRQKVAELHAKAGRTADAISHLQVIVGSLAVEGQLLRAIALCKVILNLDPAHTETQLTLGNLYARRDGGPAKQVAIMPMTMTPARGEIARVPPPKGTVASADGREIDVAKLARIPLFSELPADAFGAVFESLTMREVKAGETVITEGEPGRSMFAIADGAMQVVHVGAKGEPRVYAKLAAGDFFGEMALIASVPRLASVVATTDATLLEFSREKIHALGQKFPTIEQVIHQFYKERLIANILQSGTIFATFTQDQRRALVDRFRIRTFEEDEVLLEQGRPGVAFYVLLRGRCTAQSTVDGSVISYPDLVEGDVFGEIALMQERPVTATVKTATKAVVLGLHKHLFRELVLSNAGANEALAKLGEDRLARTAAATAAQRDAFRSHVL